jgi:hypothetical protein
MHTSRERGSESGHCATGSETPRIGWLQAPTEERDVFLFLLESEDDRLWRWFMGYEECPHAQPAALIARIRALPA